MFAWRNNFQSPTACRQIMKCQPFRIQTIKEIIQLDPKGNVSELAQGDETSAFSEATMHQIEDSLDSSLGQVEGKIFYLIPQVLLPREKKQKDMN